MLKKIGLRHGPLAVAGAGAVVCAAVALPAVAKADTAASEGCPAARVTGVSSALDTLATGSAAGPSVLFGVAIVPLSQPLPAPLDGVQSQVLSHSAERVQQLRAEAPAQIEQLRTGMAPLAGGNEVANQGVEVTASGLETAADSADPTVAPADTTLREAATIVRANQEQAATC